MALKHLDCSFYESISRNRLLRKMARRLEAFAVHGLSELPWYQATSRWTEIEFSPVHSGKY